MKKVEIKKLTETEIEDLNIKNWPIWEKERSCFDWYYSDTEECYILQGKVTVVLENGEKINFGPGDFLRFPKGLNCNWDIKEDIIKHYRFL